MSYILDALNKSERERRANETPDLATIHRTPTRESKRQTPGLQWIAAIVLILIVNAAGYFWLDRNNEVGSQSQNAPDVQSTQPTAKAAPITDSTNARNTSTIEQPEQRAISAPRVLRDDSINAIRPPVQISGLPSEIQSQIPDLRISSHLFSSDPDLRMVNINGNMIHEGDYIAEDLQLIEIAEEGVVINYLGYNFILDALEDWSFSN